MKPVRLLRQKLPLVKPDQVFLVLGGIFGIFWAFLTPAFQVPDETVHFYRAYQIAQGDFTGQKLSAKQAGGVLPVSVIRFTGAFSHEVAANLGHERSTRLGPWLHQKLEPNKREPVEFSNTVLYSPIHYAPQSIAMAVGRILGAPPIVLFYTGRMAALVAWLVLVWLAIRIMPFRKWWVVTLGLLPMAVFQAASVSADAMVMGISALAVAVFLRYWREPNVRRWQYMAVMMAGLVGGMKPPYGLIVALLLLGLGRPWRGRQNWPVWTGVMVAAVTMLGTAYLAQKAYVPITLNGNVNPSQQLAFIGKHPVTYTVVLGNTFFTTLSNEFYVGFIGVLGWLTTALPMWVVGLNTALLVAGLTRESEEEMRPLGRWQRYGPALLGLVCVIAMATLIYVSWTPVAARSVEGIQGRYFWPLALLLAPALVTTNYGRVLSRRGAWLMVAGLATSLIAASLVLFYWSYGPFTHSFF